MKVLLCGVWVAIDKDMLPLLLDLPWTAEKQPSGIYFACKLKSHKVIKLHRIIGGATKLTKTYELIENKDVVIDHKDGDTLNNLRENLRKCAIAENSRNRPRLSKNNSSGYSGVCWSVSKHKWRAFCMFERKQIHLGYFENKEDAIAARKRGVEKYFGEFAPRTK